jgi:hypothetical protein
MTRAARATVPLAGSDSDEDMGDGRGMFEDEFDGDAWVGDDAEAQAGAGARVKRQRPGTGRLTALQLELARGLASAYDWRAVPPDEALGLAHALAMRDAQLLLNWCVQNLARQMATLRGRPAPTARDVVARCSRCGAWRAVSEALAAAGRGRRRLPWRCTDVVGRDHMSLSCDTPHEFADEAAATAAAAAIVRLRAAAAQLPPDSKRATKASVAAALPSRLHQLPAFVNLRKDAARFLADRVADAQLDASAGGAAVMEEDADDEAAAAAAAATSDDEQAEGELDAEHAAGEQRGKGTAAEKQPLKAKPGARAAASRSRWSERNIVAVKAAFDQMGLFMPCTTGASVQRFMAAAGTLPARMKATHIAQLLKNVRITARCGPICVLRCALVLMRRF